MLSKERFILLLVFSFLIIPSLSAQTDPPPPQPVPIQQPKVPPPPARSVVAAKVNGQVIPEIAVYRALKQVPPSKRDEARKEIINFLVENTLIDQYLQQLKVQVDAKEVEKRVEQVKKEIKQEGQEYKKLLEMLNLTEEELREQIINTLRWDNFVDQHATEKVLKQMFDGNKQMFDGSLVRARHLLIKPAEKTEAAGKQAETKIASLRQQIDQQIAQELAKIPADADKLAKEKKRMEVIEKVFGEIAKQTSDCPSKANGGELGWFPRVGRMVEPFAKAAFEMQPYQISTPVKTEFGYHLILPTDQKKGRDVTFEQARLFVKEVYSERIRDAVLQRMRPVSKIEISGQIPTGN